MRVWHVLERRRLQRGSVGVEHGERDQHVVRVLRARAVACVRPPRRRRPGERGLCVIRDASELTLGRGVSRPLASRAQSNVRWRREHG